MRSLAQLAALCAALLAAVVPVAIAAKPDDAGKPEAPAKPDNAGKPENPGQPDHAGKPENAGNPDKPQTPEKPAHAGKPENTGKPAEGALPPGLAKKDEASLPPALPLVPLPPQHEQQPNPAHAAQTQIGETVAASATRGTVKVKLPGSAEFTELPATGPLPVGTTIDATEGSVEIGSEAVGGVEQHAFVTGSVFRIEQPAAAGGATDLVLDGGDYSDCRTPAAAAKNAKKARTGKKAVARAAAKRGKRSRRGRRSARKREVVRGLWASGKGKFRTRGSHAVASVRGTQWITVDRCHSTTVKVVEGVVDVADELSGETVTLRAGDRHVASKLKTR